MTDFETILRKRKPKGADVGRLYLANVCTAYQNALSAENASIEPPVSNEQLQKLISKLTDPYEIDVYNGYGAIQSWLSSTAPVAQAQNSQAHMYFNMLSDMIFNAVKAEDVYKYIEGLPLIMTEKQYKEFVEKRTAEILHPDGEEIANNVFQLILNALDHYVNLWATDPEAPNPLKPLKEKLESEKVTDKNILDNYNRIKEFGYYTLEDGTRSDEVSPNEWKKLVNPVLADFFAENEQLNPEEKEAIRESILLKGALKTAQIMFEHGLDVTEATEIRQKLEDEINGAKPITWHYYTDKPELTKWEAVMDPDFPEFYSYYDAPTEAEELGMYEAFNNEFPELVQALLKDMGEKYPDLKQLQELPVKEWNSFMYSWEDLHRVDFYNFRKTYTDDTAIFDGNRRAIMNGIAILRPSNLLNKSPRIDENGNYKAPEKELWDVVLPFTLETFFPDHKDFEYSVREVQRAKEILFSSLYYVQGFNMILDLIASMFKVDEVKMFKLSLDNLLERVEALNNAIYVLYSRIAETYYEDKELKEKKLEVLRQHFKPLNLKALEIPKGRISDAKANMKDFLGFRSGAYDPYLSLCIYDVHALNSAPKNWEKPIREGALDE